MRSGVATQIENHLCCLVWRMAHRARAENWPHGMPASVSRVRRDERWRLFLRLHDGHVEGFYASLCRWSRVVSSGSAAGQRLSGTAPIPSNPVRSVSMTHEVKNAKLKAWVEEIVAMCEPDTVYW